MPGGRTSHSVLPSQQEMGTCTTPTQLMDYFHPTSIDYIFIAIFMVAALVGYVTD
jgi:hypothetical protein